MTLVTVAILLLSYLIGTFPTGILVAKCYRTDLTKSGSGNVGATNVARTLGRKAGVITLLGDMLKGSIACLVALQSPIDPVLVPWCGFLVVLGHCVSLPPYLKGGKGVSTSAGMMAVLSPFALLVGVLSFAVTFAITKIVSLASLASAVGIAAFAIVMTFLDPLAQTLYAALVAMAVLVTIKHRANIRRLVRGEEPRFSSAKEPKL